VTAYIVGDGPSTIRLNRGYFFHDGPVITLNRAILPVRALKLGPRVWSFWKDGCVPHIEEWLPLHCNGCRDTERLIKPKAPETALYSLAESPHCYEDYSPRHVIDIEGDLDLPWHTPSCPVAVKYLHSLGFDTITMLCHDGGNEVHDEIGRRASLIARDLGVKLIWRLPERPDLSR
jgi:hypothetical protein